MCNGGVEAQALFPKKSGKREKGGKYLPDEGLTFHSFLQRQSCQHVTAVRPPFLGSLGVGAEDWSLLCGDPGCITATRGPVAS